MILAQTDEPLLEDCLQRAQDNEESSSVGKLGLQISGERKEFSKNCGKAWSINGGSWRNWISKSPNMQKSISVLLQALPDNSIQLLGLGRTMPWDARVEMNLLNKI